MASDRLDEVDADYDGREQSEVKHAILEKYLARFATIVGQRWKSITYIDCFAGPWESRSAAFGDTSFGKALRELRAARETVRKLGHNPKIRCVFIERNRAAYERLRTFTDHLEDVEPPLVLNASFEESIDEIRRYLHDAGPNNFAFLFVDPTGWTGYPIKLLGPLLQDQRSEVLINFMTSFITRFIGHDDPHRRAQVEALYGSLDVVEKISLLDGQEREDRIVSEYLRVIEREGDFRYVSAAHVRKPKSKATHFHLIYGTRDPKGLEVFKEAEQAAMQTQQERQAKKQSQKRKARTGNEELFTPAVLADEAYYEGLRKHYVDRCQGWREKKLLASDDAVLSYDDVWARWLRSPLVWESDLREWLLGHAGLVEVVGLVGRQHPKHGRSLYLRRVLSGSSSNTPPAETPRE